MKLRLPKWSRVLPVAVGLFLLSGLAQAATGNGTFSISGLGGLASQVTIQVVVQGESIDGHPTTVPLTVTIKPPVVTTATTTPFVTSNATLTINKSTFNLNDAYNVGLTTSPQVSAGDPISLCLNFTPGSGSTGIPRTNLCDSTSYTTNSSGGYPWQGTFSSTDSIGTWTEWAIVQTPNGNIQSNNINFTVLSVTSLVGSTLTLTPNSLQLYLHPAPGTGQGSSGNLTVAFSGIAVGISANGTIGTLPPVSAGTPVTFRWSSYNAGAGAATIQVQQPAGVNVPRDGCSVPTVSGSSWAPPLTSGDWLNGTVTYTPSPCQQGYTYVLTYTGSNAPPLSQHNSASVTWSISAPTTVAFLAYSKSSYTVGEPYTATLTTSPSVGAGQSINLCASLNGGAYACAPYTTNASGGYPWSGTQTQPGTYRAYAVVNGTITSNTATITVSAPAAPVISSISPTTAVAGQTVPVTINGSNFTSPSMCVIWSGTLNGSQCGYPSTAGTVSFTVFGNFPVGNYTFKVQNGSSGQPSNSVSFRVTAPAAPTASLSISPTSFVEGPNSNYAVNLATSPSVGANDPVNLCLNFTPGQGSTGIPYANLCTGFSAQSTNSSGGYSWRGVYNDPNLIGTVTEWAIVQTSNGNIQTNNINFTIAAPVSILSPFKFFATILDAWKSFVGTAYASYIGPIVTICTNNTCPQVPAGGTGTITWSSSDSSVATVTPAGGVAAVGAGRATITAIFDPDGVAGPIAPMTITGSVIVTGSASVPPTASISASPASVSPNGTSTIAWSCGGGATGMSIAATNGVSTAGWSGNSHTSGALSATTNYALTCSENGFSSATANATVTVSAPPPPACTTLTYKTANSGFSLSTSSASLQQSITVNTGQTFYAFVDYNQTGIDSIQPPNVSGGNVCAFSGIWVSTKAMFTCAAPTTSGSYTYTTGLKSGTASNDCASGPTTVGTPGGVGGGGVTVVASTITGVIVSCSSPILVSATSQCTATVTGTGAFSHAVNWTIALGGGSINIASGIYTAPGSVTTATVRATSQDGSRSGTATIAVVAPAPPTCSFTANPSVIVPPSKSTLSWACQNVNNCWINQGIGSLTINNGNVSVGSVPVGPAQTTIYALTCNGTGSATFNQNASVSVSGPGYIETNP